MSDTEIIYVLSMFSFNYSNACTLMYFPPGYLIIFPSQEHASFKIAESIPLLFLPSGSFSIIEFSIPDVHTHRIFINYCLCDLSKSSSIATGEIINFLFLFLKPLAPRLSITPNSPRSLTSK